MRGVDEVSKGPKSDLTKHERNVLTLIRDAPGPIHAYALQIALGLPSGTMIPLLRKLSTIRAIEREGERLSGRGPSRICYRITENGKALLKQGKSPGLHPILSDEEITITLRAFMRLRVIVHDVLFDPRFGVKQRMLGHLHEQLRPNAYQHTTHGLILRMDNLPRWISHPYGSQHFSGGYYPQGPDHHKEILHLVRKRGVSLRLFGNSGEPVGTYYSVDVVEDIRLPEAAVGKNAYGSVQSRATEAFQAALRIATTA